MPSGEGPDPTGQVYNPPSHKILPGDSGDQPTERAAWNAAPISRRK
jgi:hypothetical protein